jgi:hypothetical protein
MLVSQYCYFAVKSTAVSADEITDRLLIRPDETVVMGSKNDPERGLPRYHAWKIVRRSVESVDEQIQHLVDRLVPVQTRLVTLVADSDVAPVMQVVRYFHDERGVQASGSGSAPIAGLPRPLGWSLSVPVLDFLTSTKATLDVDEYDLSGEDSDPTVPDFGSTK